MNNDNLRQPFLEDAPQRFSEQNKMSTLLVVNLLLAIMWELFLPVWGVADYVIGFVVGALALAVHEREYGQRIIAFITFILYVVWSMLVSNAKLAWLILQPHPRLNPGIVGVPLDVSSDLEIIILATVITLTPGTLSIDLRRDDSGHNTLYVHNLVVNDPDEFRRHIKGTFERRLLFVSRGEAM
jgi:multicomponent Na+:H+ antiporter subunit E